MCNGVSFGNVFNIFNVQRGLGMSFNDLCIECAASGVPNIILFLPIDCYTAPSSHRLLHDAILPFRLPGYSTPIGDQLVHNPGTFLTSATLINNPSHIINKAPESSSTGECKMKVSTAVVVVLLAAILVFADRVACDRGEAAIVKSWPCSLAPTTRQRICEMVKKGSAKRIAKEALAALFDRQHTDLYRTKEFLQAPSGFPRVITAMDRSGAGSLRANFRPLLEGLSRLGCGRRYDTICAVNRTVQTSTPDLRTACITAIKMQEMSAAGNTTVRGVGERSRTSLPKPTLASGTQLY